MKKVSRLSVLLYGLCAAIWTVRAVLEIVYQTYRDSVFWFVMNLLCAAGWIGAFAAQLKRSKSSQ